ncbi:MAG TPA: serine protease, partial [Candidatus Limnocylindrales bacterium]|nr:serine protease [Candidatus Limnocylindrales bacterium]
MREHPDVQPRSLTLRQAQGDIVRRRLLSVATVCIILTGCTSHAETTAKTQSEPYVAAYRQLHPSVVLFTMRIPSEKHKGEWDEAYGSGVVVESGSWGTRILTDAHVVADAKDLVATIGDGPHAPARVIATTGEADDLAIVDVPLKNQRPVKLGSIAKLVPGTAIGVLGYPIPDAFDDEHLGRTVS